MNDAATDEAVTAYLSTLNIALLHLDLREAFERFCNFLDENSEAFALLAMLGVPGASTLAAFTQGGEHETS